MVGGGLSSEVAARASFTEYLPVLYLTVVPVFCIMIHCGEYWAVVIKHVAQSYALLYNMQNTVATDLKLVMIYQLINGKICTMIDSAYVNIILQNRDYKIII